MRLSALGVPRPDWLIVGAPTDDGVMLLASTEMTHAELVLEQQEYLYALEFSEPIAEACRSVELTAGLRTYTLVYAATYQEALANLMEHWAPPTSSGSRELENQRALPPGF